MFEQRFKVLLESELEKAELVLAVKAITDELQSMAEKISKMQIEDVSSISERLKAESGTEVGSEFQTSVNDILQQSLTALQSSKSAVDNEALFLSGDAQKDEMMPQANDDMTAELPNDMEDEDLFGAHEAGEGPAEEPIGRVKKESVQASNESLNEGAKFLKNSIASKKKQIENIKKMANKDGIDPDYRDVRSKEKIAKIMKELEKDEAALKKINESIISEDFEMNDFDTSNIKPESLPGESAMNASLRHIEDAFSPEMKDRSSKVYDIAREAELVAVGRLKKSPEETKALREELSDEIENIAKGLAQLHPTDYGKIVALSGLAKVLVRAKRKLDDLINGQVKEQRMIEMESMIKSLKERGLTESETYKKSVVILENYKLNKTERAERAERSFQGAKNYENDKRLVKGKKPLTQKELDDIRDISDKHLSDTHFYESSENGYVCFYKGKRIEVYAPTTYAAQRKAATIFKAKKPYEINVVLAQKGGEDVTHIATESKKTKKSCVKKK